MHITRLRLLGFKSFVEPTELVIEHGLTGVVGPNGCGKSNLLEALRWVMGETSYKNMRASAMDDVIFSGTNTRPRRESAEVSIVLDNTKRRAPAEFNETDVLEITRRIERDAGSAYKINGADVRARDVQLLFADASTGARSPALVQQGRIGEIVNSKPQARRRILEEAAGITGLYSRRHEAELRLKAAEGNLERLQDIMGQIGSQLNSLKRQARQAKRYKEISTLIQQAEAIQFHLSWIAAGQAVSDAESALQEAMRNVGTLTQQESEAIRTEAEAAEALLPLRNEEATRAAVLHRLEIERDTLDREEEQAERRKGELNILIEQLAQDLLREEEVIEEAKTVLGRMEQEEAALKSALDGHAEAEAKARAEAETASTSLKEIENSFNAITEQAAETRAQHDQLTRVAREQEGNVSRLTAQSEKYAQEIEALEKELPADDEAEGLRKEIERLSASVVWLEEKTLEDEQSVSDAANKVQSLREEMKTAELRARELETEVHTLTKLLKPSGDAQWTPILDQLEVLPGYEAALAAALGDDLDASADPEAPARWTVLDSNAVLPPVPIGSKPLSDFVTAPEALERRLSMTGVVEYGDGNLLQTSLSAGQRLVSKEGDLWRWDGFSLKADAPTPAAMRLAERNRLSDLEEQAESARKAAKKTGEQLGAAIETLKEAEAEEKKLRLEWRDLQGKLGSARDRVADIEAQAKASAKKLAGLKEAQTQISLSLEQAEAAKNQADETLKGLSDVASLDEKLETLKSDVHAMRQTYSDTHSALSELEREARIRQERLTAIVEDRERWSKRRAGAEHQITSLKERSEKAKTDLQAFDGLPEQIKERRQKILDEISRSEATRKDAADALAKAETHARECAKTMKALQGSLTEAREQRARIEAKLESARERRSEQARTIRDTLSCAPEDCLKLAGVRAGDTMPELAEVESKLIKLKADRERLGGVNLRAEEEAAEIETQVGEMETEKADLEEAIVKLRQGIASLNREGRKRLLEAFEEVNGHFKRLFAVLFGGGDAELQLIESDDPLEAGLEIIARPPGKKPQVLTLLSGGEKALTALSLIFAVFLTNPSPICVLDEVDAPLDDANVDRFCTMMEEMRSATDTRFLVITHHPMTMARMNRLFGVTMGEKGVSQLVSVDLATAEGFREAS